MLMGLPSTKDLQAGPHCCDHLFNTQFLVIGAVQTAESTKVWRVSIPPTKNCSVSPSVLFSLFFQCPLWLVLRFLHVIFYPYNLLVIAQIYSSTISAHATLSSHLSHTQSIKLRAFLSEFLSNPSWKKRASPHLSGLKSHAISFPTMFQSCWGPPSRRRTACPLLPDHIEISNHQGNVPDCTLKPASHTELEPQNWLSFPAPGT